MRLQRHTSGAILVISLIILLLLTLLGLSSFQLISTDTIMARNVQDNGYAFQVAESVLIEAESQLLGDPPILNAGNFPNNAQGLYLDGTQPNINRLNANNAATSAAYRGYGANNASNAYYIIVQVAPDSQYVISVMAQGRSGATQVVLQSTMGSGGI